MILTLELFRFIRNNSIASEDTQLPAFPKIIQAFKLCLPLSLFPAAVEESQKLFKSVLTFAQKTSNTFAVFNYFFNTYLFSSMTA